MTMTLTEAAKALSDNGIVRLIPAAISVMGSILLTILWFFSNDFIVTHITNPISDLHGQVSILTQKQALIDLKNLEQDLFIKANRDTIESNREQIADSLRRSEFIVDALKTDISSIKTSLAVLADKSGDKFRPPAP